MRRDLVKSLMILSFMIFGVLVIQDIIYYGLYENIIYWLIMGLILCAVFSTVGAAFGLRNNRFMEDVNFMIALIGMAAFFICFIILIFRIVTTTESLLHFIGMILSVLIYKKA